MTRFFAIAKKIARGTNIIYIKKKTWTINFVHAISVSPNTLLIGIVVLFGYTFLFCLFPKLPNFGAANTEKSYAFAFC